MTDGIALKRQVPLTYRFLTLLYGLLAPDPVDCSGETEYSHEGLASLLVACGNSAPLLEPGPETLDDIAIGVNPLRTGDRRLIGFGRDCGLCTDAPDVLAKAPAGMVPSQIFVSEF
jgi:hypothetical protein